MINYIEGKKENNITLKLIVYSQVDDYTEITNTMKAEFVSRTGVKNTRIPGFHSQLFQ